MRVVIVWHIHHFELPEGVSHRDEYGEVINLDEDEDLKIIGVFSSDLAAEAAIARAQQLEGFRDEPDCFVYAGYVIDEDHWEDGFITV